LKFGSEEVLLCGIGAEVSLVLSSAFTLSYVVVFDPSFPLLAIAKGAIGDVIAIVFLFVGAAAFLVRDLAVSTVSLLGCLPNSALNDVIVGFLQLAAFIFLFA